MERGHERLPVGEKFSLPSQEREFETISLSEEWAELSAALCTPEYIRSLGTYFKTYGVKNILECACGDGHVLRGLGQEGLVGIGVDPDPYLFQRAQAMNKNPEISFYNLSVAELETDSALGQQQFDAVMCRGNSVTAFGAWGTTAETFDAAKSELMLRQALKIMWGRLRKNGVMYLDVTRQEDIDRGNHALRLDLGDIHIQGEITIDDQFRRRDAFGQGTVKGRSFRGGSSSLLIGPTELKQMLIGVIKPKDIWTPTEVQDAMYEIICARK